MNRSAYLAGIRNSSWPSVISHALIWLVLAAACLLLAWFVAVLHDVTERGEQRRLQQRASGTLLLPDELGTRAGAGTQGFTVSREKAAAH